MMKQKNNETKTARAFNFYLKRESISLLEEVEYDSGKCKGITSLTLEYLGGAGANITLDEGGKCKGITSMTLSYIGGAGADITVDEGIGVDNGDGTYTITPEPGKSKLSSNTEIYIDGVLHTEIHTSCSKPIDVGDVYGDFTIVDLDKITEGKGVVTDNGDGTYTITPAPGESKLSSNTKIYIDGVLHTEIHTSCSKPLNEGDVYDDFTVVGVDKILESKCKGITSLTLEYLGGAGADITLDEGAKCKGITSMTLSYTGGAGADITVDKGEVTDNGDGTYTITPQFGDSKLSSNTEIFVDGVLHTEIHTSCSKPIEIDDEYDFELL